MSFEKIGFAMFKVKVTLRACIIKSSCFFSSVSSELLIPLQPNLV